MLEKRTVIFDIDENVLEEHHEGADAAMAKVYSKVSKK
jgi:hypothetical protein